MDRAHTDTAGASNEGHDWQEGQGASSSGKFLCVHSGCKSSGKTFKRSYELERHSLIHSPKQRFFCPVLECKQKKKKKDKFYARKDKFREHVANHGELAVFLCPIAGCTTAQVQQRDFESHVTNDHDNSERLQIQGVLKALQINYWIGLWKCPIQCGFFYNGQGYSLMHQHLLEFHDVFDLIRFHEKLYAFSLKPYSIRVSCPTCKNTEDFTSVLLSHLERHTVEELDEHCRGRFSGLEESLERHYKYFLGPKVLDLINRSVPGKSDSFDKDVSSTVEPFLIEETPDTSIPAEAVVNVEFSGSSRDAAEGGVAPGNPQMLAFGLDMPGQMFMSQQGLIQQSFIPENDIAPPQGSISYRHIMPQHAPFSLEQSFTPPHQSFVSPEKGFDLLQQSYVPESIWIGQQFSPLQAGLTGQQVMNPLNLGMQHNLMVQQSYMSPQTYALPQPVVGHGTFMDANVGLPHPPITNPVQAFQYGETTMLDFTPSTMTSQWGHNQFQPPLDPFAWTTPVDMTFSGNGLLDPGVNTFSPALEYPPEEGSEDVDFSPDVGFQGSGMDNSEGRG